MSRSRSQPSKSPPESDPRALLGSTIAGRYRVEALLGKGGMGSVYRVQHLAIRKPMALKVLSEKMMSVPAVVARFEREATLAAHLDHPHVVSASDFGRTEEGRFYLVLEYVEGKELRDVLDELGGPLPPVRAFYIARQIASALTRAQSLGIVHRDLKPENIMLVRRDGHDDYVKVLDFGLALLSRHLESTGGDEHTVETAPKITQVGEIFGTPAYMAPEQTIGAATDIRTDLYAVGVVLYEMLTGVRPFAGQSTLALIQQHLAVPAPPMRERAPKVRVPEDMEALVMRLLAKQPAARFQSPEELIEAIDRIGAAHSLAWPGRSSPSLPAVSRASAGRVPSSPGISLGQRLARAGALLGRPFSLLLGKLRPEPEPEPKDRLGRALDSVRRRLGFPAKKPERRVPLWLLGAGVALLLALLSGALWYTLARSEPPDPRALPSPTRAPAHSLLRTRAAPSGGAYAGHRALSAVSLDPPA